MQVNQTLYGYNTPNAANTYTGAGSAGEAARAQELPQTAGEQAAAWDSPDKSGRQDNPLLSNESQSANAGNFEITTSKPQDNSSKLTQRLVAALGQFEVRQVLSDANKDLISLRLIAAIGKGDDARLAEQYIKKLEKFLRRADRKLKDLDKEDMMKLQRARLEQQKQKKRAEDIKAELRRKQNERRTRENGYLLEDLQEQLLGPTGADSPDLPQDAASEAAIAAQAEAMAVAEISAESAGSADGGVALGISAESSSGAESTAGADISGGGEAAV